MRLHIITTLLAIGPMAALAAQDTTRTDPPKPDTTMQMPYQTAHNAPAPDTLVSDNAVLAKMHETNQLEITLGRLAARNGSSQQVKTFGTRLARDHQAADKKVTALAKKLGITLTQGHDMAAHPTPQGKPYQRGDSAQSGDTTSRPAVEMETHAQLTQRLTSLRGAEFDAAFFDAMIKGHEKTIALLERAQGQTQQPELRTLIAQTLPAVRAHLQTAQSLSGSITSSK
jgi:putative membrane protein